MNWLRFADPHWLHLLWTVPPVLLLLLFGIHRKKQALQRFYSAVDPAHLLRHKIQAAVMLLSYLLLTFALARPQWGAKQEAIAERLDVMFAVDISTSMLAEDADSVRRLTRAKESITALVDGLEGDRVGALYFADASFIACPLTSDRNTFKEFLAAITPETLIHSGTRIGGAIETATERLSPEAAETGEGERGGERTTSGAGGHRALILFSDGEDHGEEAVAAAAAATEKGIHVYCVGVGDATRAVPIPLPQENDTQSTGPYKRDAEGHLVLTRLNETHLQAIAAAGNGAYYHANAGTAQLQADLARLEKQRFRLRTDGAYQERFQLFVIGACLLLIYELFHFAHWHRRTRT